MVYSRWFAASLKLTDISVQYLPKLAMNKQSNSLGKRSTNTTALNTVALKSDKSSKPLLARRAVDYNHLIATFGGLEALRERVEAIKQRLSHEKLPKKGNRVYKWFRQMDEIVSRASIGMPNYSDDTTLQYEASRDIPTLPLDGSQFVQRTCYVPKIANLGTAAGGFYAELKVSDLAPFVASGTPFRISEFTSWTGPLGSSPAEFSGVSIAVQSGSQGTEVMPCWSENWTRIGEGYSGIRTVYPLGGFPLWVATQANEVIGTHFTSLGGTGGITGHPVIFHVVIEALI